MMRRVGILVGVVAALAASVAYLGDRGHSGGQATPTAKVALLAQEQGAYGVWKTKRHMSVTCVRGSARPLCVALRYYVSHRPTRPCLVHGIMTTRVVISGRLGGSSTKLTMGSVCNPPPPLARAVHAIYLAAFSTLTPSRLQPSL
jgi:hypothetical protein